MQTVIFYLGVTETSNFKVIKLMWFFTKLMNMNDSQMTWLTNTMVDLSHRFGWFVFNQNKYLSSTDYSTGIT